MQMKLTGSTGLTGVKSIKIVFLVYLFKCHIKKRRKALKKIGG